MVNLWNEHHVVDVDYLRFCLNASNVAAADEEDIVFVVGGTEAHYA